MGLVSLQEEEESSVLSQPCEDTVRRQPPVSQEEGSHRNRVSQHLDLGLPGL